MAGSTIFNLTSLDNFNLDDYLIVWDNDTGQTKKIDLELILKGIGNHIKEFEWSGTQGQTTFTITPPKKNEILNLISLYIGGVKQNNNDVTISTVTRDNDSITFDTPLPSNADVRLLYFSINE